LALKQIITRRNSHPAMRRKAGTEDALLWFIPVWSTGRPGSFSAKGTTNEVNMAC
jgi:hypothetical protein